MSAGAEGAVAGETAEQQQQQQHVDAREVLLAQEGSIAAAVAGEMAAHIEYSEKYMDDRFEYRHVILPKKLAEKLPSTRLLRENEWRGIGVQQSRGWSHYAIHKPEPHILLFRRPLGTDPASGQVDPMLASEARSAYEKDFV